MSISEFNRFFKKQSLAATYKPTLLKCLLDLGDYSQEEGGKWIETKDDSLIVDLNFVVARFLRYYHPLKFKFKLKQDPQPEKTIQIYDILERFKDKIPIKSVPSKKQFCNNEFSKIREVTIKSGAIKQQVLPKLLNDCNIYDIVENSKKIVIKKNIVDFMKENKNLLEAALNNMIATYLEGCNASPNISTKLRETIPRTTLKKPIFEEIIQLQDGLCFFCQKQFDEFAQEHFLPWNFIFRTENFNITAACKTCNSSKNDRLPHGKYLEQIIQRNAQLSDLPSGYSEEFFRQLYEICKIEYHGKDKELWMN